MKRMIISNLILVAYIGTGVLFDKTIGIKSPPFFAFQGFCFGMFAMWAYERFAE